MPSTPNLSVPGDTLSLDLDLLDPSPFQPRKDIDPTALASFAATLRAAGQLQPIAVRPKAPGRWEIVAGHRRTAAFKLLRDGATTDEERRRFTLIRAVVVEAPTDRKMALAGYLENAAREALTLVDEADALAQLRELGAGSTAGELAKETGQAERRVRRLLRLAEAPPLIRDFLTSGVLVEVAGSGESPKRERRTLDLMAALEFLRLHTHHRHQNAATADDRTRTAITRALTENWSLRRIQNDVDRLLHKTPTDPRPTAPVAPSELARSVPTNQGTDEQEPGHGPARDSSDQLCSSSADRFTLYLTRLKAASRAQLEAARVTLDDVRQLIEAQLQLTPE